VITFREAIAKPHFPDDFAIDGFAFIGSDRSKPGMAKSLMAKS
jgi:hypothetical protein